MKKRKTISAIRQMENAKEMAQKNENASITPAQNRYFGEYSSLNSSGYSRIKAQPIKTAP
ncbi:MAG: hypothetical protein J5858_17205 [Lentisphaeria bacterium]|nr:hypothetical protein [Lentisphaeria bacterium]